MTHSGSIQVQNQTKSWVTVRNFSGFTDQLVSQTMSQMQNQGTGRVKAIDTSGRLIDMIG